MDQVANVYAQVLLDLKIPRETIQEVRERFQKVPQLYAILTSPIISRQKKQALIHKVMPAKMHAFFYVLFKHRKESKLSLIFKAYEELTDLGDGILKATYYYAKDIEKPTISFIEEFLKNRYHAKEIQLRTIHQPELIGGYRLKVKNEEYDHSIYGCLQQLEQKITWR